MIGVQFWHEKVRTPHSQSQQKKRWSAEICTPSWQNRTRSGTLTVNRKYMARHKLKQQLLIYKRIAQKTFMKLGQDELKLGWHDIQTRPTRISSPSRSCIVPLQEGLLPPHHNLWNKQILEIWSWVSKCFSFTVSLFSFGWLSLAVSNLRKYSMVLNRRYAAIVFTKFFYGFKQIAVIFIKICWEIVKLWSLKSSARSVFFQIQSQTCQTRAFYLAPKSTIILHNSPIYDECQTQSA